MDPDTTTETLRRRLENLLNLDLSAMGYEAKARHNHRVERARRAYLRAINGENNPPQACNPMPRHDLRTAATQSPTQTTQVQ